MRQEIRIKMEENDIMIAAEPAAALLSENVRKSGLLSQVQGSFNRISQQGCGKGGIFQG